MIIVHLVPYHTEWFIINYTGHNRQTNWTLNTSTQTYHWDNIYKILTTVLDFVYIQTTDGYKSCINKLSIHRE